MIAVTGATGNLGKLVIQHLLKNTQASNIVALVRNPTKAEALKEQGIQVRKADYNDSQGWNEALQGIDKLLLISSSEVGQRDLQHKVVIAAAKEVGVRFIAYTSILKADSSTLILASEHLATEIALKESGIDHTILRNGWYLENHTEQLAPALQFGVIQGAAKEGRFSSASRNDFAEAAAVVLTGNGHVGKIYELAGDVSFTMSDLAAEVTKRSGKTVVYKDLSFTDYVKALVGVGVPEGFASILADSDVGASNGELFSNSKDLTQLIGRAPTSLSDAIKNALVNDG